MGTAMVAAVVAVVAVAAAVAAVAAVEEAPRSGQMQGPAQRVEPAQTPQQELQLGPELLRELLRFDFVEVLDRVAVSMLAFAFASHDFDG